MSNKASVTEIIEEMHAGMMGLLFCSALAVFMFFFGAPTAAAFFFLGPFAWVPAILTGLLLLFWVLGSALVVLAGILKLLVWPLYVVGAGNKYLAKLKIISKKWNSFATTKY